MRKSTIVDRIEIERDGTMNLRFKMLFVDDDGSETVLGQHSATGLPPGDDLDARAELLKASFAELKSAPPDAGEIARAKALGAAAWTPGIIKAYRDKQAPIEQIVAPAKAAK